MTKNLAPIRRYRLEMAAISLLTAIVWGTVFAAIAMLAGCGGGESDAPPRAVTVALLGDSTQAGVDGARPIPGDGTYPIVAHPPAAQLQAEMDAEFGPGAVIVTGYGVPSTTAADAPHVVADVIVANYELNDMVRGVSVPDFRAHMAAIGATLIETPIPAPYGDARQADYIAAERTLGVPVADVFSYVQSLPKWQGYFPNPLSVHPSDALYVLVTDSVLAPAVAAQVRAIQRSRAP